MPFRKWEDYKCKVCHKFVWRQEAKYLTYSILAAAVLTIFAGSAALEDYQWCMSARLPEVMSTYQYDWLDTQGQKILDLGVRNDHKPMVVLNSWSNATGWGTNVSGPLPHLGDNIRITAGDSGWHVSYGNTTLHMSNRLPWTSLASVTNSTPISGPTSYVGQANFATFWNRLFRSCGHGPTVLDIFRVVACYLVPIFLCLLAMAGIVVLLVVYCDGEDYTKKFCYAACGRVAEQLLEERTTDAHNSGLTVQQIWSLWVDIKDELLDYSRCHLLDADNRHVCREANCKYHGVAKSASQGNSELKPMEPNMHLVVSRHVKPLTADKGPDGRGCSYATLLNGACPVPATHFVSHCWEHNFESFATALTRWACGQEIGVWVCSFALNQHGNIGEMLSDDICESPFALALGEAEKVLLVLDEKAMPLTRSWCVYEMYLAKERDMQPKILMDWSLGPQSLFDLERKVKQLDLRKCTASQKSDHDRIMKEVGSKADHLNKMVRRCIEDETDQARIMLNLAKSPTRAGAASSMTTTLLPLEVSDREPRFRGP